MVTFLGQVYGIILVLLPIALVVLASALVARRGWLPEAASKGLSDGIVYLFLPCLIFAKIADGLEPAKMPYWWAIPLVALGVFCVGASLGALIFRRRLREAPDVLPLGFLQNAGFLVLAIGERLVPQEEVLFATYTFLYVLGHSPLLWSFGKLLISRDAAVPFRWHQLLTPPLFANLLAVVVVLAGLRPYLPGPVMEGVRMLGEVAVPASLVVLGASLSLFRPSWREDGALLLRAVGLKLVLLPAILIGLLSLTGLGQSHPVLALMLVLQAAAPQATNLIVFVRTYGGNLRRTGTILLVGNALSLLTIPLWLAIWGWD
jgi:predicted permease